MIINSRKKHKPQDDSRIAEAIERALQMLSGTPYPGMNSRGLNWYTGKPENPNKGWTPPADIELTAEDLAIRAEVKARKDAK